MQCALQGLAADWAREKLATGWYEKQGKLQRINTTQEDASEAIKGCTKLVSATGFKRNRLPELSMDGIPMRYLLLHADGTAFRTAVDSCLGQWLSWH